MPVSGSCVYALAQLLLLRRGRSSRHARRWSQTPGHHSISRGRVRVIREFRLSDRSSLARISAVTTFYNQPSGIAAFALVTTARAFMPIVRYIAWVGTSLLALLFVANWFLPESLPAPAHEAIENPVIRIASIQQPPERIVIDTSQPTIVPPPTLFGDVVPDQPSPLLESYVSTHSPATVVSPDKKERKVVKRQAPKVAPYQPAIANTPAVASGNSGTTAQPTRLSLANIISGRLVRNLFNLD